MKVYPNVTPYQYEAITKNNRVQTPFIWWLLSLITMNDFRYEDGYDYDDTFKDYLRASGGIVLFASIVILPILLPVLMLLFSNPETTGALECILGGISGGIMLSYGLALLTAFVIAPLAANYGVPLYTKLLERRYMVSVGRKKLLEYEKEYLKLAEGQTQQFLDTGVDIDGIARTSNYTYNISELYIKSALPGTYQRGYYYRVYGHKVSADVGETSLSEVGVTKTLSYLEMCALAQVIAERAKKNVESAKIDGFDSVVASFKFEKDHVCLCVTIVLRDGSYIAPISWEDTTDDINRGEDRSKWQ